MQFSTILLTVASVLPTAFAVPTEGSAGGAVLQDRATVKLNQYANADDCAHDHAILYHAAPVSGKCYNLDAKTGSFFLNTGGYWYCKAYSNSGCSGDTRGFELYSGNCYDRGKWNSVKCS